MTNLMIRWIQIGILTVLLCARAFGQADNSKASASQTPDTQQGAATNSQQTPSAVPDRTPSPPQTQEQEPSTVAKPQQPTGEPEHPATQTEQKQADQNAVKKSVARKRRTTKKSSAKNDDKSSQDKIVVRNGGAKDSSSQLSPGMTSEQALHSRENTAQLLATTDANLKAVSGHQLSTAQQSMLDQIHAYVRQSKAASASGDLTRAHTLAYKAHLLSDNLASK